MSVVSQVPGHECYRIDVKSGSLDTATLRPCPSPFNDSTSSNSKQGTLVNVRNAMSRLEMRRTSFLKQKRRVLTLCVSFLQDIATIHCGRVAVRVLNDQKLLLATSGAMTTVQCLQHLLHLQDLEDKILHIHLTPKGIMETPQGEMETRDMETQDMETRHMETRQGDMETPEWELQGIVGHPLRPVMSGRPRLGYDASAKAESVSVSLEGGRGGRSLTRAKIALFSVNGRIVRFPQPIRA